MTDTGQNISVSLTRAEALVLFEWLSIADSSPLWSQVDPVAQQVLWRLEGRLESTLLEPLASNYEELLAKARLEVQAG